MLSGKKKNLIICGGIFVFALALRLLYLYQSSANPTFHCPIVDSETYHDIARHLANGGAMSDKFFWQGFFYPFFLAAVYYIGGASILLAKIVQVILGSLTCVITYQLGKKIFSQKIGIAAGIVTCIYGPLIFYDGELLSANWEAFWSVTLVLLLIKCSEKVSWKLYGLLGICSGLAIMTRATFAPFLAAALVWLLVKVYKQKTNRKLISSFAVMVVGIVTILLPVAILNFKVTGHFRVMPSSGGINLFIGNNPDYQKTITVRPGWGWEELNALPEEHGITGDLVAQEKYFKTEFHNFILHRPIDFAAGILKKTGEFLNSRELPRNLDIYLFGQWSSVLKVLTWKTGSFGVPFGILLPFALLGLLFYYRRIPGAMWLFLIFVPAAIILVFVTSRYKTPMIPVLAIIAAAGGAKLIESIRTRQWKTVLVTSLFAAGLMWVTSKPAEFAQEKINYKTEMYRNVASVFTKQGNNELSYANLQKALQAGPQDGLANFDMANLLAETGKTQEAIRFYQISLASDPTQAKTHNNFGNALVKAGQQSRAIEEYRKAVELKPKDVMMRNNLARALTANGQIDEAIEEYRKALAIDSKALIHNNLGMALLWQNKFDLAEIHFTEAIKLEPANVEAIKNLGVTLFKQGKLDQAKQQLQKAVTIDDKLLEAHYYLGGIYYQQNDLKQTVSHWERTVQLKPDLVEIHGNLAVILAADEKSDVFNPAQAIEHAKKACQLTGFKDPAQMEKLANAYAAGKQYSLAVQTTQKAIELAVSSGQKELEEKLKANLELYKKSN